MAPPADSDDTAGPDDTIGSDDTTAHDGQTDQGAQPALPDADHAEHIGEIFANPAAVTIYNAQILAQSQRLTDQLQQALQTRPIIDQAIGILRSRNGDTADQAFNTLRRLSQNQHTKLADLAARIVEESAAAARARRTVGNE